VDSPLKACEVNAEYMSHSHQRNYKTIGPVGRNMKKRMTVPRKLVLVLVLVLAEVKGNHIKTGCQLRRRRKMSLLRLLIHWRLRKPRLPRNSNNNNNNNNNKLFRLLLQRYPWDNLMLMHRLEMQIPTPNLIPYRLSPSRVLDIHQH
jgi:hypothetical protein